MSGKFELYLDAAKKYRFRLKAGNGEIIGSSEGYVSTQGAENGIESVRTNSQIDSRYTIFAGANSKHYFNLKAGNGEIILQSQGYASEASAKTGVASVKANAPSAQLIDLT